MKMKTLNFNGQTFDINDDGALRYDEAQGLTDDEMAQARENAGAAAVGEGGAGTVGPQGPQGEPGEDGTSVTVADVSESTEDGGSNVVTFSDGTTLTVKNGSKGSTGDKGDPGADYVLTDADRGEIANIVKEGNIPDYWISALQDGTEAINKALLNAGHNKSAFLFYSDAHWNKGAQMSPTLLKYLFRNTGMSKTFFGGDIVNNEADDYDTMAYLWDWRKQLKDLPNHHSVVGNHDDGNTTNNLFDEKYVYGYLLAAEETPDVVRGDSGLYYYIDSPAEKTRYLCLDTGFQDVYTLSVGQSAFITDALKSTPNGWHIVVIAHIWYEPDYDQYDVRPIPIKGLSATAEEITAILDNYNSRLGVFADCGGWVEFCIGGHVHIDYDGTTTTGIPILLVETDSSHTRSGLSYTAGTTEESSVNGIIADYDAKKIYVVRIGRGESREITVTSTIVSYTNLLPSAIGFDGTILNGVGYAENARYSTSSNAISDADGWDCTGLIPVAQGDTVYLKNITMYYSADYQATYGDRGRVAYFDENYNTILSSKLAEIEESASDLNPVYDDNGNLTSFMIPTWSTISNIKFFGICAQDISADSIITVNEEIG